MASMVSISSILFLLVLCFQTQSSFQRLITIKPGWNDDLVRQWYAIKPEENQVAMDVDEIVKAISDKGYKIMSSILQKKLGFISERSKNDFYNNNKKNNSTVEEKMIKFYGNITVFVPSDDAFKNQPSIRVENYAVPLKLDKEAFYSASISMGSLLPTVGHGSLGVTNDSHHHASINNVKIKDWDIYNNGGFVVHGVEELLDSHFIYYHYPPNHVAYGVRA